MAAECVKEEGESKAEDGSDEEEEEDELLPYVEVGVALVAQRLHVEDDGAHHKGNEPDQVSPDVAYKLSVNVFVSSSKMFHSVRHTNTVF